VLLTLTEAFPIDKLDPDPALFWFMPTDDATVVAWDDETLVTFEDLCISYFLSFTVFIDETELLLASSLFCRTSF